MSNRDLDINDRVAKAVATFWRTRKRQKSRQQELGRTDQGSRSAVTGGAQMDGFVNLVSELIQSAGIAESCIFTRKRHSELPGYFRATKGWDLVVVSEGRFVAAVEFVSEVGPYFGQSFNVRTDEAMGAALDLWAAFGDECFGHTLTPWLGYLLFLEDCPESQHPVRTQSPYFRANPEFEGASYCQRYELFCRRLFLKRLYNRAAFLVSDRKHGLKGNYTEPATGLSFEMFAKSLMGHVTAYV